MCVRVCVCERERDRENSLGNMLEEEFVCKLSAKLNSLKSKQSEEKYELRESG